MTKPKEQPRWLSLRDHLTESYPGAVSAPTEPTYGPRLFNRNLSWLCFNDRVLNEAADPTVPPLERLRFIGIVSSNLDEFFSVRVAEVARLAHRQPTHRFPDGLSATLALAQIREHVLRQKSTQAAILQEILKVLEKEGIQIIAEFDKDKSLENDIIARLPSIKFLIRKNSDPVPPLASERINVFIRFPGEYAIISISERAERLLELPSTISSQKFILLERWICARAREFFPQREVLEAFPFKIIRDADLRYHPDEEEQLEEKVIEGVLKRHKAKVIRLEVDAPQYSEGAFFLATSLGLDSAGLYRFNCPLDLRTLSKVASSSRATHLLYPKIEPTLPPEWSEQKNVFGLISKKDILLHHPYDSFDLVVLFLQQAARDPHVTEITHTMYRTTKESPIMQALKEAAQAGKKVTVYIEIKARFDELNNVRWANELKKAGVRVVRPMSGYKVHCKMTQVIRKENGKPVSYIHLGTGNYHPTTARQYTDLGLLTKDRDLGEEAQTFFSTMSKRNKSEGLKNLLVAPGNLHSEIVRLIREEIKIQRHGGKGHIISKLNSLVDPDVIEELYKASQAGVKVDLLVRGICCLRPGVKGLSENIRVQSIIDRFLEHSRIHYFRADGEQKIFLSSADWMPRNFFTRYEIAFPVNDPSLKRYLRETILANSLKDNLRAWLLRPDGTYVKVKPNPGEPLMRSQLSFQVLAQKHYRDTVLDKRLRKSNQNGRS